MNILITGGTGFVGSRLVDALKKRHRLAILTRNPPARQNRDNVSYYSWDALSGEPVPPAALDGIEAVVNLMGENLAAKRWSPRQKQKLEASRIAGTRHLIGSLKQPLKVFVSAGAIGIYPTNVHDTITEETSSGKGFLPRTLSKLGNGSQQIIPVRTHRSIENRGSTGKKRVVPSKKCCSPSASASGELSATVPKSCLGSISTMSSISSLPHWRIMLTREFTTLSPPILSATGSLPKPWDTP